MQLKEIPARKLSVIFHVIKSLVLSKLLLEGGGAPFFLRTVLVAWSDATTPHGGKVMTAIQQDKNCSAQMAGTGNAVRYVEAEGAGNPLVAPSAILPCGSLLNSLLQVGLRWMRCLFLRPRSRNRIGLF